MEGAHKPPEKKITEIITSETRKIMNSNDGVHVRNLAYKFCVNDNVMADLRDAKYGGEQ